ncbi:MAG TPA: MerR family transcriptional regulator [Kofleriaceae bacterium]|nr:MerR family transcriptional regulator [Kofleriaceae bacterium]
MSETWTLSELVDEAAQRLEALPPPKNGQVRAVPDERTIRYYGTIGLLDRPAAMRGRTALYSRRHLAQVVAIKRMQAAGHSLADIQAMWSTLDDTTLGRMSGVQVATGKAKAARKEFWKREATMTELPPPSVPMPQAPTGPTIPMPMPMPTPTPMTPMPASNAPQMLPLPTFTPYSAAGAGTATTINLPLEGGVSIVITVDEDAAVSLSPADVRALRAAAAPLVTELAKRGFIGSSKATLEEGP